MFSFTKVISCLANSYHMLNTIRNNHQPFFIQFLRQATMFTFSVHFSVFGHENNLMVSTLAAF